MACTRISMATAIYSGGVLVRAARCVVKVTIGGWQVDQKELLDTIGRLRMNQIRRRWPEGCKEGSTLRKTRHYTLKNLVYQPRNKD